MSRRRVAPVEETVCRLACDGRTLRTFHCSPNGYEQLALGWLVGAGMIRAGAPLPHMVLGSDQGGAVVHVDAVGAGWLEHEIPSPPAHAATPMLPPRRPRPAEDWEALFRELYARAERYRETGGLHAAALVREGRVLAHAEDAGRHNAVDRVLGAALAAGDPLDGAGLVLSARVSGEIGRKAAAVGLAWIASRSVPTTLALRAVRRAGTWIVARAASPEPRLFEPGGRPLGVILAGGRNRRFGGRPKALERVAGIRILERVSAALAPVCDGVALIANDPETYAAIGLPTRPDVRAGGGPVAGIHTALAWAREEAAPGVLVVACDMPFVSTTLLEALWRASEESDGAVAESDGPRGVEPLCAAYRTGCLDAVQRALDRGDRRVIGFFDDVRIARLPLPQVASHGDPALLFMNVNSADELERARTVAAAASVPA